jgi:hypothetical protein
MRKLTFERLFVAEEEEGGINKSRAASEEIVSSLSSIGPMWDGGSIFSLVQGFATVLYTIYSSREFAGNARSATTCDAIGMCSAYGLVIFSK